jgi:hypothetical protein
MSDTSGMNGTATPPLGASFTIPLPPGLSVSDYLFIQSSTLRISIITAVALSIVLWDFICLLPDEIALYKTQKVWNTVAAWAFVILRYSGILATLPSLFFTSVPSQHCQLAASLSQVGAVLVTLSSAAIFSARVNAIWNNRIVLTIVCIMYAILAGSWIAVSTQYRAVVGPAVPLFSNCQMQPIPDWGNLSFISSVAFDVVILVLTLIKLPASITTHSKVGFIVYRDSLLYFICTALTNLMVLTIQTLPDSGGLQVTMLKPMVIPFSTVVTVTLGSRVFLNLRLYKKREMHGTAGSQPDNSANGQMGTGSNRSVTGNIRFSATVPTPLKPLPPHPQRYFSQESLDSNPLVAPQKDSKGDMKRPVNFV